MLLASALALVIDNLDGQPDNVTSTFVSLLTISAVFTVGLKDSWAIVTSAVIGAAVGCLVSGLFDLSLDLANPDTVIEQNWLNVGSVRISMAITAYLLFFLGKGDPGSMSSGTFSALFVVLIRFTWAPLDNNPWLHDNPIVQTFVVRIVALATAVISALLVNLVVSSGCGLNIFRSWWSYIYREANNTLSRTSDPANPDFQNLVNRTMSFRRLIKDYQNTLNFRQRFGRVLCNPCSTLTEVEVSYANTMDRRSEVLLSLLTCTGFLKSCLNRNFVRSPEAMARVEAMIKLLQNTVAGTSDSSQTVFLNSSDEDEQPVCTQNALLPLDELNLNCLISNLIQSYTHEYEREAISLFAFP